MPRPGEELYDLEKDPFELHNLATDPDFATILNRMKTTMKTIRTETGDVLPAKRTPDEFTRDTGLPLPNRIRPRLQSRTGKHHNITESQNHRITES